MTGFAIHANEPLFADAKGEVHAQVRSATPVIVRDMEWFKTELVSRGVRGFEIICGDYKEYFYQIPPQLLDAYLALRPLRLHRTALDMVLAEQKAQRHT